ncbi:hypothetical protein ACOT81_01350 [Streptomyces sp. WI04-05B]|uniref:hypothetical protein n=1 Tax=Streptomyces TaxID=1883 RepID=UPI0029BD9707|nr:MULTISPECIES: hypothetical protein [unclassified Streptomyces]MDX2541554.1 hypothetical protein [Streptomyces sp. WI04-05B]MDX2583712.1 hypothetical protein [Streptomyces sp. WI04-05A]MDX3745497.1 hypothetical protein [Streptomyces sp. AK08-02]
MTTSATTPRPGDQLASTACGTRVVVIRAPADAHPRLACAGEPMVPATSLPAVRDPGSGTIIGKRYVNATGTLELLCTASGAGELTCDGTPMTIKAAKPLPASD